MQQPATYYDQQGMQYIGYTAHPGDQEPGNLVRVRRTGVYLLHQGVTSRTVPQSWAAREESRLLEQRRADRRTGEDETARSERIASGA